MLCLVAPLLQALRAESGDVIDYRLLPCVGLLGHVTCDDIHGGFSDTVMPYPQRLATPELSGKG